MIFWWIRALHLWRDRLDPAKDQRYLSDVPLGVLNVDGREDANVRGSRGVMLSGNVTMGSSMMHFGQPVWSKGQASMARCAENAGLMRRPGLYDDFLGFGVTVAGPSNRPLSNQTTAETFCRFEVTDNILLKTDAQDAKDLGLTDEDTWVVGLRERPNLGTCPTCLGNATARIYIDLSCFPPSDGYYPAP